MSRSTFEMPSVETLDQPLSPEILRGALEKAVTLIETLPSRNIPIDPEEAKKFAETPQGKEKLSFHNVDHTLRVVEKYKKIIAAFKKGGVEVRTRDEQIGVITACFHDTVQAFREVEMTEDKLHGYIGLEKKMRVRLLGDNEKASSDNVVLYMRSVNEAEPGTFTADDEELARKITDQTVPDFDPKMGTVIQKNLDKEESSSPAERALALADIGTAGIEGPEKFLPEGDALFREENLDIADAIYGLKEGKEILEEYKAYYRARMLGWSTFQPIFAQGRQNLLEKEIEALPEEAREILRKEVFIYFEASINAAKSKALDRQTMNFEQIAKDMGYSI